MEYLLAPATAAVATIVTATLLLNATGKARKTSDQDSENDRLYSADFDTNDYFKKILCPKDQVIIDMLATRENRMVSWVVTDPDLPDNPIIFASGGFTALTGYAKSEIEGRNCRFLQGAETKPEDVEEIRRSLKSLTESNVCLLNYRKDGTTFANQFFLCPLFGPDKKLAYYIGVQRRVESLGRGQQDKNPGWVYTMGLRED